MCRVLRDFFETSNEVGEEFKNEAFAVILEGYWKDYYSSEHHKLPERAGGALSKDLMLDCDDYKLLKT